MAALAMTVGAEWCTELASVQDWVKRLCSKTMQALARSADFTFANEAEVLHMASTLCKARK